MPSLNAAPARVSQNSSTPKSKLSVDAGTVSCERRRLARSRSACGGHQGPDVARTSRVNSEPGELEPAPRPRDVRLRARELVLELERRDGAALIAPWA